MRSSDGLRRADTTVRPADGLRFLSLTVLPRFMGAGTHEGAPYYVMEHLQPLPEPRARSFSRVMEVVGIICDEDYTISRQPRDVRILQNLVGIKSRLRGLYRGRSWG